MTTLPLFKYAEKKAVEDWTFRGKDTRYFTHRYHDYPARMIPQITNRLIEKYAPSAKKLFDPYCGSGTALVEGLLHGIESYGTDLNPLARLLAKAKTSFIDLRELDKAIKKFLDFISIPDGKNHALPPWLNSDRVDFWFKPKAVRDLLTVYSFISKIQDKSIELFFLAAFSETIRESSNTRSGEFKLFRKPQEKLEKFNPNVFRVMTEKLGRNREAYGQMLGFMGEKRNWKPIHIFDFDTIAGIPPGTIRLNSIDIVITSPPYGDSRTTVAYGQFSRLSSDWLAFTEAAKVDSMLMGGKRLQTIPAFQVDCLNESLKDIALHNKSRALEIASFYSDLEQSIQNVGKTIKPSGFACYVIANRKIQGVVLPTDEAVISFFEANGFKHVATHVREIPNKRMPSRNSPSNIRGATDNTMIKEFIVVMQKQ